MLSRLNLVLALSFAAVVVLMMLFRVDHSQPNYQIILGDDMTYSPAYTAYAPNPNFSDGRTLQSPVPGTIARGWQPINFEATPEDALRAAEELVNSFDLNTEAGKASAERGQVVFNTFCATCHGGDGAGNGPVAQRGFPPPPSLLIGKSREMKDGQLFHILTYGQNSMPQFAAQLSPDRRWDVVNYIRRLQQDVPSPSAVEPAPPIPPETATSESAEESPAPNEAATEPKP